MTVAIPLYSHDIIRFVAVQDECMILSKRIDARVGFEAYCCEACCSAVLLCAHSASLELRDAY